MYKFHIFFYILLHFSRFSEMLMMNFHEKNDAMQMIWNVVHILIIVANCSTSSVLQLQSVVVCSSSSNYNCKCSCSIFSIHLCSIFSSVVWLANVSFYSFSFSIHFVTLLCFSIFSQQM